MLCPSTSNPNHLPPLHVSNLPEDACTSMKHKAETNVVRTHPVFHSLTTVASKMAPKILSAWLALNTRHPDSGWTDATGVKRWAYLPQASFVFRSWAALRTSCEDLFDDSCTDRLGNLVILKAIHAALSLSTGLPYVEDNTAGVKVVHIQYTATQPITTVQVIFTDGEKFTGTIHDTDLCTLKLIRGYKNAAMIETYAAKLASDTGYSIFRNEDQFEVCNLY